jgi:hypothetical protein
MVVFDFATSAMEERINVVAILKKYVQQAFLKHGGVAGGYPDENVAVIVASVPRQSPGTLDCGAFGIYYALNIFLVSKKQ